MRVMNNDKWYKLRAGKYTMNTWNGDSQLTYVAVRLDSGWVLSRQVDGSGLQMVADPQRTLRAAQVFAEDDSRRSL
jgi:hypothetical protein